MVEDRKFERKNDTEKAELITDEIQKKNLKNIYTKTE